MSEGSQGRILIYQEAERPVEVRLDPGQETVWLSLVQIAELFGRDKSVISRHFKNIFENNELERGAVVAKNATTASDGKVYQVSISISTRSSRSGTGSIHPAPLGSGSGQPASSATTSPGAGP